MDKNVSILLGQVVYVEGESAPLQDNKDALRIKVLLDSDGNKTIDELPYCFPLLPKVFQSVPKVGEGAFIINASIGNSASQRYYIGPIISQPQFHEKSLYNSGRGNAVSLIQGGKPTAPKALPKISNFKESTKGSFPDPNDVAVLGRGQEDIILKYNKEKSVSEVDIRSGIRQEPTNVNEDSGLKGNVIFNNIDPAYIQVKYKNTGLSGMYKVGDEKTDNNNTEIDKRSAKSLINIVADKINIISHKDKNAFGQLIADKDTMISEKEMDLIMSKLHKTVYGDELVTLLKVMINAIATHTHPFPMLPPYSVDSVKQASSYDLTQILSDNVRIS